MKVYLTTYVLIPTWVVFVCFAVLLSFDFFKSMTIDVVSQSVCLLVALFKQRQEYKNRFSLVDIFHLLSR